MKLSNDGVSFRRRGDQIGSRSPATGFQRLRAVYTATGGETSINLNSLSPQISYVPGAAQIAIKRSSGGPMISGLDYTETNSSTITFPSGDPLIAGEVVEIIKEFSITGVFAATNRGDVYTATGTASQTLITADFSWPYNMNSTKGQGAVRVYINGVLFTRGVNYTEVNLGTTNTNQVLLTAALSGGERITLVPTYQTIDQSAAATLFNSTQLTNLQNNMTAGTQAFVDQTSLMSVPNTQINNRARIPNLLNDLKASHGIERIIFESIFEIQSEYGSNGEPVRGVSNDDRPRFVGLGWDNTIDSNGAYIFTSTTNDYIEIVFKGTALNILTLVNATSRDIRATVDGGAESGNLYTTGSAVITARGYAPYTPITVASGLSSSTTHTVKIRTNTSNTTLFYGFEIISADSSTALSVNPGSGYLGGVKYQLLTASSVAHSSSFDSGTLGSKGGRAVAFLKTDGTIGKYLTPTNTSQANLSSADHTNEELLFVYNWRIFGAGRSDDFSLLTISGGTRYYTLDDGYTSLAGTNLTVQNGTLDIGGVSSDFLIFSFFGTGLDVVLGGGSLTATVTISIDSNASIGNLPTGTSGVVKIVSGLQCRFHTVKFTKTTSGSAGIFKSFNVYGPKKPVIPSNAIEIADYFIMPTFAITGTSGNDLDPSVGVVPKYSAREFMYVGSWTVTAVSAFSGGLRVDTNTNSDYAELTVVGTGIEVTLTCVTAATATVQLDGVAYTGSASINGATWTPGTSTISAIPTSSNVATFAITGLTFGPHKIRITKASGTTLGIVKGGAVTPLHMPKWNSSIGNLQNTPALGSNSLNDLRKFTLVKEPFSLEKGWVQAVGITSGPTTTSSAFITCPEMIVTITTYGRPIEIFYAIEMSNSSAGSANQTQLALNGGGVGIFRSPSTPSNNYILLTTDSYTIPVAAGRHMITLLWANNGGTTTATGTRRILRVREI